MAGDTVITVVGNLTADPELRFTPSGAAVANFTVASTPRNFDRQSGEWKDGEALFLRAHYMFEAYRMWGNVPYLREDDTDLRKAALQKPAVATEIAQTGSSRPCTASPPIVSSRSSPGIGSAAQSSAIAISVPGA